MSQLQPILATSSGICPMLWQASSRKGTLCRLATAPIASALYTLPASRRPHKQAPFSLMRKHLRAAMLWSGKHSRCDAAHL